MSTFKLREDSDWSQGYRTTLFFSICASLLGMMVLFLLIKFAVLPVIVQGYTIPVNPAGAEPGVGTADLLREFNVQGSTVLSFGYVAHPYLTGRGRLLSFAGDNIQIFEYPNSEMARSEALAIPGKSPRLAAQHYFHVYRRGNVIALYFGHNADILRVTNAIMGSAL